MKRTLSFLTLIGLVLPVSILPYYAEKSGVKVLAVDYARTPEALCMEFDVPEDVAALIGKGVSTRKCIEFGMRPVGISITNTTDKPMMLSPAYGKKSTWNDVAVPVASSLPGYYWACILGAEVTFATTIVFFVLGATAHYHADRVLLYTISGISLAGLSALMYVLIRDGSAFNQFSIAAQKKFEELNFKDETLILPGQTIHKLLLCTKDEYISRFPLVIYPLEKRENMIVFDVDLRP